MTVGQRIAQKRKEAGLSQEALGDRLGVSRQSIYKWESGAALPEVEKLISLSQLFGVSVGWLLGVEEAQSPEPPSHDGELTEAQLKMVESIVNRYVAALPKPRRKWPLFLAAALLLFAGFHLFQRLDRVDRQYDSLQTGLSRIETSVDRQINGISSRVEEILKAQNDLTADYSTQLLSKDLAANTALFSFRAIPKAFSDGMTAWLEVENAGETLQFGPYHPQGQTFAGQVSVPLTDATSLYIIFESNGQRQTQLLDTYDGLYTETTPQVPVDSSLMWMETPNNTLVLGPDSHDRYVWIREPAFPSEVITLENAGQILRGTAAVKHCRVGLFKNQELICWAQPCQPPDSFHGFEDSSFYCLPEVSVPLEPGDIIHVAAVVEDVFGRFSIHQDGPYILDAEDQRLTRPTYSEIDSDLSHWNFDK